MLAPLALGGLHATPATWRAGMALPAVALTVLYLLFHRVGLPAAAAPSARAPTRRTGRLSLACRVLCWLVAAGIGVEFSVIYFAAELLTASTGLSAARAATAVTVFYVGLLAGRIAGAGLARTPGRTPALLWASLLVTLAGLCIFWLSSSAAAALAGQFVAGVGIANQFPLALALALAAAPGNTDNANARGQLLGAILLLTAPFLLGALADQTGLHAAFAIPVLLTALCCPLLYLGAHHTPTPKTSANGR